MLGARFITGIRPKLQKTLRVSHYMYNVVRSSRTEKDTEGILLYNLVRPQLRAGYMKLFFGSSGDTLLKEYICGWT